MSNRLSRQKVINWAVKVADKEGIEAVTLTRVANDLGVSQPALYRHVGGIHDLRKALTLRARDLLAKDLLNATSGLTGKEAVRALAYAWRRGGSSRPGLMMLPGQVKILGDVELEASVERIVGIISQTLSALDLDEEARIHAALLVRSVLYGFTSIETSSGRGPKDFDDAFEQMITLIWIGLQGMQAVPSGHYQRGGDSIQDGAADSLARAGSKDGSAGSKRSKGGRRKDNGRNGSRLTPDDVVETAARIAEEHGLAAISITRIAQELGVRQPALYRHVDGVDALSRALALRAQSSLLSRIARAGIGRARDDAVSAVAVAWREYVLENPGSYSSISQVISTQDPLLDQSSEDIVETLVQVLRGYALPSDMASHIATCIRSALHGFCLLEKDGGYPRPYSIGESFDRLIRLLIAGIRGMVAAESVAEDLERRRKGGRKGSRTARR